MRTNNLIFALFMLSWPILSESQELQKSQQLQELQGDRASVKFSKLSLYQGVKLPELQRFTSFDTQSLAGASSVWVLFQPECSSCSAQISSLQCLSEDTRTLAVGFWGTRERLSDELKFLKFKGKKLMASPDFEKKYNFDKLRQFLLWISTAL